MFVCANLRKSVKMYENESFSVSNLYNLNNSRLFNVYATLGKQTNHVNFFFFGVKNPMNKFCNKIQSIIHNV